MRIRLLALLILIGLFISCDSDDPAIDDGTVISFPLVIGNSWVYKWSIDDERFPENLRNRTVRITITGKGEIDDTETFIFETVSDEEPELTSIHHYALEDSKLKQMAYKISAIGDANARVSEPLKNYLFGVVNDLILSTDSSLVVENPPRVLYDYPLEIRKSWTSWENGNTKLIVKEVTEVEELSVPAGTFKAYKIVNSGAWYETIEVESHEYISKIGLLKRTISFESMLNDELGNAISEKPVNVTVELVEFNINE